MGAGAREAERSSCRFVLTRPPFSRHTRTAAQNRESQRLKTTRHAINARAFCHGQRPMVVNGDKKTNTRGKGKRRGENMYSWRETDKRTTKRDKDETRTCIRGVKQTIARRKGIKTRREHVFVAAKQTIARRKR